MQGAICLLWVWSNAINNVVEEGLFKKYILVDLRLYGVITLGV